MGLIMVEKNKGGRPTKYREEYCDLLIKMAKEGASFTEFRGKIGGISRKTFAAWQVANPEFRNAYEEAKAIGEAYWEERLRTDLLMNKEVNTALAKLYFANRFGWSDKVETKNENATVEKVKSFGDMYD